MRDYVTLLEEAVDRLDAGIAASVEEVLDQLYEESLIVSPMETQQLRIDLFRRGKE